MVMYNLMSILCQIDVIDPRKTQVVLGQMSVILLFYKWSNGHDLMEDKLTFFTETFFKKVQMLPLRILWEPKI